MTRRAYLWTYLALLALLIITYGSTFIPLGDTKPVVNIGLGAVKATIILLFFMHLIKAEPLTRVAGAIGFLWLILMFVLGMTDYLWR